MYFISPWRQIPQCYLQNNGQSYIVTFTPQPLSYCIGILTHLKLCFADAIHNFKWVKMIQIWPNGGQLFWILADLCQILRHVWKVLFNVQIKNANSNIIGIGGWRVNSLNRYCCQPYMELVCGCGFLPTSSRNVARYDERHKDKRRKPNAGKWPDQFWWHQKTEASGEVHSRI